MNSNERNDLMDLAEVPVGGRVYVTSIRGSGSVRGRIMAMGLVPGTAVEVLRRAPMGDPLEISVKGYNLSLRAVEAAMVIVSMDPPRRPEPGRIGE